MVTERNAEQTRQKILQAAFDEMYQHGYQGMRIESVLNKTDLAKGALYHHFPNKLSLGHAVVDEILMDYIQQYWDSPLRNCHDPLATLQQLLIAQCDEYRGCTTFEGCPLNKLVQEMSALDEGFCQRLEKVHGFWVTSVSSALSRGQLAGIVKSEVDNDTTAMFIIASLQGVIGAAKCKQSVQVLIDLVNALCGYIESLRTG